MKETRLISGLVAWFAALAFGYVAQDFAHRKPASTGNRHDLADVGSFRNATAANLLIELGVPHAG